MRALVALFTFALAACGPSAAARRAQTLIDAGDYAGAAKLAAAELDKHPKDADLWRIRMRAALGEGDARAAVGYYAAWRGLHGGDDREAMRMMALTTVWQGLSSPSAATQVQAIGVVERLELERLADAVADDMADDDDVVAAAAAIAVLHAYPQAPRLASDMLSSDDAEARRIAVEGIARKVGARAGDDLRALAADADPRVRRAVARALGGFADPADTGRLTKLAGDPDAEVRAAALAALARGKRGDLSAVARGALADDHLGVRLAALELLAASGAAAELAPYLGCTDPAVAPHVARLLAHDRPADAAAGIACAARDADWTVRAAALNASQAVLDDPAWRALARTLLGDPDVGVRLAAARLLGDDPAAVDVLVAALGDADRRVSAATDLATLDDARGLAALAEAVGAPDPAVRRAAVDGYGLARRVDGGLVPALADDDPAVRIAAAEIILAARSE